MSNYSIDGFTKGCIGSKLIVLLGRDDEENTLYAIKVCKILNGRKLIIF